MLSASLWSVAGRNAGIRMNDSTYTVYFCLGFDEYYIYDSEQKEWYDFP